MKKLIFIILLLFLAMPAFAGERVRGHWKDTNRDGVKDTYVQPYYRSERNDSVLDNYSTKGTTNPYTGKKGTVDPYKNLYKTPSYGGYGNQNDD